MLKGSCLCGGILWQTAQVPRPVVACHCSQCRKTSGHVWASTQVNSDALEMISAQTLVWYQSSPQARRGFCSTCGASVFWQREGEGTISMAAGCIDGDSGLTIAKHIYCASKGDYYEIEPGPEKHA